MKMRLTFGRRLSAGYALLVVLGVTAVTMIVLAATMSRTGTVAKLNNRNNQYHVNLNAAEAAVEKIYARMAYDFQAFGPGGVSGNLSLYRTNVPTSTESPFWGGFEFSDGQGNAGHTYVNMVITNYTGPLPSQYPGLIAVGSPIYRIISNVRSTSGNSDLTNAVQEDVLLAMVPLTTYAIFYNGLLEFSTCATMNVRGRVHANGPIYVGAGGSSTLTFYDTVTTTDTLIAPNNAGTSWSSPYAYNGSAWRTYFNGSPNYKTNVPSVSIAIPMTNTHALIEFPPAGESPTSSIGEERMYNKAQIVLAVSNNFVSLKIQHSVSGLVPGADPSPIILTNSIAEARTNYPFLSIQTNSFVDQREDKTNVTTQIDVGKYDQWIQTNADVISKFPVGSGTYPTILFVSDNRTVNSKQMNSVRLTNGVAIPSNGGLGFTVATPNPLYTWGNYNAPHPASTDTSAALPAALMTDALTILSDSWRDSTSFTSSSTGPNSSANNTVNAAILTGIVPSTGSGSTQFSGGVHNLPRMLENWSGHHLWLNTSIINLFNSKSATNKFVMPGGSSYYVPPLREFSFDTNFLDPNKQPPGVPAALLPIRYNWATPPAADVTYNVTP
jgi:hypothetical protein